LITEIVEMKWHFGIVAIALALLGAAQEAAAAGIVKSAICANCDKQCQDREALTYAAYKASGVQKWEDMANCMKRAVILESKLSEREKDMLNEAYENLIKALYQASELSLYEVKGELKKSKKKNPFECLKEHLLRKKDLQRVLDEVLGLLGRFLLPPVEEDIAKAVTILEKSLNEGETMEEKKKTIAMNKLQDAVVELEFYLEMQDKFYEYSRDSSLRSLSKIPLYASIITKIF